MPIRIISYASAQSVMENLKKVGVSQGPFHETWTLFSLLGLIIGALLGLLGVIFIVLIIYAGFNWMTASGNEDKITKARSTILHAVIGLIIIISSYVIWNFIAQIL